MKSKIKFVVAVLTIIVVSGYSTARIPARKIEPARLHLRVAAPKADCVNIPVCTTIELLEQYSQVPVEEISVVLKEQGGASASVPGQIVMPNGGKTRLCWILPAAKAGRTGSWTATLSHRKGARQEGFSWKDEPGDHLDLLLDGRKVVRYMYAYDDSTPERLHETYKPFHHVFDAQGENLLTNSGPGGLYPHHRGLFIGWNKLEFGGETLDLWGMKGGTQRHRKFLEGTAGPVLAISRSQISWNDTAGGSIIIEQREITVYRQPDPTILLLDFHTRLKAAGGDVYLDGNAEHGGFQYRAHNDVSIGSERAGDVAAEPGKQVSQDIAEDTGAERATYLFHEDGIDPREDENIPWAAMAYGLNGRRYNVQHMDHPDNPRPTLYSAYRDYGRFGAFFKKKIASGETLALRYRIRVVEGELPDREELAEKHSAFINGPKAEVIGYE